jgi:hypothetical protein
MPPLEARSENKQSFLAYSSSPLGQIVIAMLRKITTFKKRYPPSQGDSIEKKHAYRLMLSVEAILITCHEMILSNFDKGNIPWITSIPGLIKDFLSLKHYIKAFTPRERAFYLELKEILPSVIKKAESVNPRDFAHQLVSLLELKQKKFFKNTLAIPGIDLNELFKLVKDEISSAKKSKGWVNAVLRKLRVRLKESAGKEFPYVIHHPMTYELALMLAQLVNSAPKALQDLIPFFNPKSIDVDLHNTWLVAFATRKICRETYILKHLELSEEPSRDHSYSYNYVVYPRIPRKKEDSQVESDESSDDEYPGSNYAKEIDGVYFYGKYIKKVFAMLLTEIQRYDCRYLQNTQVADLLAQSPLLNSYKNMVSEQVQIYMINCVNDSRNALNLDQLNGAVLIQLLSEEINRLRLLQKSYQQAIKNLSSAKKYPFEILHKASERMGEKNQAGVLLPHTLLECIGDTNVVPIVSVISHINAQITRCLLTLNQGLNEINSQCGDLEQKSREAIKLYNESTVSKDEQGSMGEIRDGLPEKIQNSTSAKDVTSDEIQKELMSIHASYVDLLNTVDPKERRGVLKNLLVQFNDLTESIDQPEIEVDTKKINQDLLQEGCSTKIISQQASVINLKEELAVLGKKLSRSMRISICANLFYDLDNYVLERDKRYYVKDAFTEGDKLARLRCINNLKRKLNEYSVSGDAEEIFSLLQDYKVLFPGPHFRTVLSKITCALMDYDDDFVGDRNKAVKKIATNEVPKGDSRKERQDILLFLSSPENNKYHGYVRKIKNLYNNIILMKSYAATLPHDHSKVVRELVDKLCVEVDRFVIARPEKSKKDWEEAFIKFNRKFVAVLHSKDDVMNQLGKGAWKIIANILIALFTLGGQLLSSKLRTGRFHGFFDKTAIQEKINQLDVSVNDIGTVSA